MSGGEKGRREAEGFSVPRPSGVIHLSSGGLRDDPFKRVYLSRDAKCKVCTLGPYGPKEICPGCWIHDVLKASEWSWITEKSRAQRHPVQRG